MEIVGRLANSSNATLLARLDAPGSPLAVYKPAAGERPLWDFPEGTLYRREVAAFEVSEAIGWNIVPPTVLREQAPYGPGSVQAFIDHDPEQHYFTLLPTQEPWFRRLAVFDMVCNNADRKGGHCVVDGEGRLWALDHGLTFNLEPKLRTVVWDFAGRSVPARERRAVAAFASELVGDTELATRLAPLLAPDEVAALAARAHAVAALRRFPEPSSGWSFPWPLV
jgi:uncharacterized repeat protein (TIGR03843 family)